MRTIKCRRGIHPDFEVEEEVFKIMGDDYEGKIKCPECVSEEHGALAQAQHTADLPKLRREAGIPRRFAGSKLTDFIIYDERQEPVIEAVHRYLDHLRTNLREGRCIVVAGPPGTGKTMLACAVVDRTLGIGASALYTSILDAAREVKSTYGRNPSGRFQSEQEAYRHFVKPDLLVIDEVGIGYNTEAEAVIIWEIVNQRYNEMKATCLISNENWDGMVKAVGARIMDRMLDCNGLYLPCTWDSYRARGADA